MPDLESTRALCGSADLYSVVDLKSAFWQIGLKKSSRDCTSTWVTGLGCFRFKVCPQGAKSSPKALQAVTDIMFADMKGKSIITYGDDCIIPAKDTNQMMERLEQMFQRVRAANIKIQAKKSDLFKKSVMFLGQKLDRHGISANMDRIKDLLQIKMPSNKKELQRFLGICCFFRKFVKDFAEISVPLTDGLKKDKFEVSKEMEESFHRLKERLANATTLAWPDINQEFKLYCDASQRTVGAVLSQGEKNNEKPIAFASKRLNDSQELYPIWKK